MKSAILVACALLAAHVSYGQKMEYSAHFNSGGSAYRGPSARSSSILFISDVAGEGPFYNDGSYTSRLGFSYGLAAQVQRITQKQDLFGVQAGYEVLRNRQNITEINGFRFQTSASGHITLTNQYVNAHPFFGHRFALKTIALDLTAGPEVGLLCRSHLVENITTESGYTYSGKFDSNQPKLDVRARLNLAAYYKHIGLTLGYSRGLTNYYGDYAGGRSEAYSQLFRVGLAYRI